MTKRIFIIAALFASLFLVACNSDEEELVPGLPQASTEKKDVPIQVASFSPPSQTVITLEKAKQYVDASAGLVLLGAKWSEEIEKASDEEKIKILKAYNLAREQVCAKVGLLGLPEYDWLTQVAVKDPANEAILKEAGFRLK